jgi:hypothetical protein
VKVQNACAAYLFIGVRGSGEALGMGDNVNRVRSAFVAQHPDTKELALRYSANAVPLTQNTWQVWTWLNQIGDYQPSAWSGSVELVQQISTAITECGASGQQIVIVGYSQGAWAVHAAMNYLAATDSSAIDHISAVGLVADPLRSASSGITNIGSAGAGGGIASSQLGSSVVSYNHMVQSIALANMPQIPNASLADFQYPSSVGSRTIELCDDMDVVCDFDNLMAENSKYWLGIGVAGAFAAGASVHMSYPAYQTQDMGQQLAALAN